MAALIERHRTCTTERERVDCETKIWNLTSTKDRVPFKSQRRVLLWKLLGEEQGESQYAYFCRVNLHDAPDRLWDAAEEKAWSIGAISSLNSQIRTRSRSDKITMEDAAYLVLSEKEVKLPNSAPASYLERPRPMEKSRKPSNGIKADWIALRAVIGKIVSSQAADLTEIDRIELLSQLENDVRQVIAAFSQRMALCKKRLDGDKSSPVNRRQVEDACEFLHINAPSVGELVDLKKAKSQMRRLVRLEHPDTGSGNTESYNAIMKAYVTLEEYNRQNEGGKVR